MFVGISVLLNLDPYTILYSWLAAAAALSILVVQILVCVAILRFFSKDQRGTSLWQNRISPILAIIGLGGFTLIALSNLSLLTGDESWRVWLIPVAIVVLGVLGWWRSAQAEVHVSNSLASATGE